MKKVRIKDDLTETKLKYDIVSEMQDMIGKVYHIDSEFSDSYVVDGWEFAKQDCEIVEDEDIKPIYTEHSVRIGKYVITYDYVKDMTAREIATMLVLLHNQQGITKQQIRDMAKDNEIRVGDKVFVNFTCKSDERASNGVRLDEEMLKYNHTIQVVERVNDKGCFLKNVPLNYAHEWLTKVVE